MRSLTIAILCVFVATGLGQEKKILDLKTMKVGDVGKLPPTIKNDKEEIFYKVMKIQPGLNLLIVKQWRYYALPDNFTGKKGGEEFAIRGLPMKGIVLNQKIKIDHITFEVAGEVALNSKFPFSKIRVLREKK